MSRVIVWAVVGVVGLALCSCQKRTAEMEPYRPPKADYGQPLQPGELALRKISRDQYPDFARGLRNRDRLLEAVEHSLKYMEKLSSRKYFPYATITHRQAVASLQRFLELLHTTTTAEEMAAAIRDEFDVYESVGYDGAGTVYFTGYYTPIFDGRLRPDDEFRYPLYKLPPDLVKDDEGRILGRREPDGSISSRYPTRREIEEGRLLDGWEIAWLRSAFEAYVVTVQGSARLRLETGELYELGYAGNNGHPYTPISDAMIEDGIIGRKDRSLATLLRYFSDHPGQTHHYAWKNDRYVFFDRTTGGPFGSLNVPVTPFRSLATDKEVFPRAAITFLKTELPVAYEGTVVSKPCSGFALDQDTGGAIRAAGRCDVYMGIGPSAEALAGHTGSQGRLYYIFLRPQQRAAKRDLFDEAHSDEENRH